MDLNNLRNRAKRTAEEIEKAAKEHVELAKNQYDDYTTRHGDPVDRATQVIREPLDKGRDRVIRLSKDVNQRTESVLEEVSQRTEGVTEVVRQQTEEVSQLVRENLSRTRKMTDREVTTAPVTETDTGEGSKPEQETEESSKSTSENDSAKGTSKGSSGSKKSSSSESKSSSDGGSSD